MNSVRPSRAAIGRVCSSGPLRQQISTRLLIKLIIDSFDAIPSIYFNVKTLQLVTIKLYKVSSNVLFIKI